MNRIGRRVIGWTLLPAILALALALRVYVSVTAYCSSFDSATVGLMALHILKGERPLFFYGQNYFGSLEAYLAAGLFALFGPSELALSLSPILFSLGWVAATFLLFQELMGRRAGLVAALCAAVPGWNIMWYSIGSYGGYPAAFCFGTLCLWLALRIADRDLTSGRLWGHAVALGALAGLALWTHFITLAYLLTAALVLIPYGVRHRRTPRVLFPFLAGGAFLLAGLFPVILCWHRFTGAHVAGWQPSVKMVLRSFAGLFGRPLQHHIFFPGEQPIALKAAVLLVLLGALILCLWRVRTASDRAERRRLRVPAVFGLVFLVLYLPHPLASLEAPRYTIPLWTMTVGACFGAACTASAIGLRRLASGLLILWIGYSGVGNIVASWSRADKKRGEMEARQRVATKAAQAGIRKAVMVGGDIFGHEGQVLSFAARDRVAFVSAFDERYQPAAQAAEADPACALACEPRSLAAVEAALRELRTGYRVIRDPYVCVLSDLRPAPVGRRSVVPSDLKILPVGTVRGQGSALTDRTIETCVEGDYGQDAGLSIDLGAERPVNSIWLLGPDMLQGGLPQSYAVFTSGDGGSYEPLREVPRRIANSCVSGNQVFFKGYYGMMECRFEPVSTRYIRLVFESGQRHAEQWQISEVFVFEDAGGTATAISDDEVKALASELQKRGVVFTVCDRWLSARLLDVLPWRNGRPPVYPRYNPKHTYTHVSRSVSPTPGVALAIPNALTAETERVLNESGLESTAWDRRVFEHYTLFVFKSGALPAARGARLHWTGHALLKWTSPETGRSGR